MAAAGPRGRDGPSPREFTTVRHFMMADLGLSGLPLLVYARIFGFCDAGCGYFESKGGLARFLNVQERSVHRAIRDLLDRGLIEECGVHAPARGHATKRYRIVRERLNLNLPRFHLHFLTPRRRRLSGSSPRTPRG